MAVGRGEDVDMIVGGAEGWDKGDRVTCEEIAEETD